MRDHTKACQMGHDLPMDRCPSDNDSRVAFTIGVWVKGRGSRPSRLTCETHPLLGEYWHLELEGGRNFWLQAWPHPQNQGQTLIVPAAGVGVG